MLNRGRTDSGIGWGLGRIAWILASTAGAWVRARSVFVNNRDVGRGVAVVGDSVFMSSRDGVQWDRRFRQAWLRPGRDPRNWTHRNQTTAVGIIELTYFTTR